MRCFEEICFFFNHFVYFITDWSPRLSISKYLWLNLKWFWSSSYPGQLRLRDGALWQRAAMVRRPGQLLVAGVVIVQQNGLRVHRLLIPLQLRRHVVRTHLVVEAILAQVAVNSWTGQKN